MTIRGLTEVQDTIDGRWVFTPGGASGGGIANGQSTFDFSQIPSALVAGIDVYKTAAADQIEGGLGGSINVRLRKPFDFGDGLHTGAMVGTSFSQLANSSRPSYNFYLSDTGKTGIGKLGVMVSGSFNDTPWREDNIGVGTPTAFTAANLPAGIPATAYYQNAYIVDTSWGSFQTSGFNAEIQWQPVAHLQLYAGANHNQWWNIENQVQNLMFMGAPTAGTVTMMPGSKTVVKSASFQNAFGITYADIRDLADRSTMVYFGGNYHSGNLLLDFDVDHYVTAYEFKNNGVYMFGTVPTLTYDISGTIPSAIVTGGSLYDPNMWTAQQAFNRLYPATGKNTAGKIDATYNISKGLFTDLRAGVRYSDTETDDSNLGLMLGGYNIPAGKQNPGNYPGEFGPAPIQNFFDGYREPQPAQYLSGTTFNLYRDPAALLTRFGAPASVTPQNDGQAGTPSPTNIFDITEKTTALYLMPEYAGNLGSLPFDGNIGLRVVQTKENTNSNVANKNVSTGVTTYSPISISSSYTDWLPSLNFRLKLTPKLFVRLAVSKAISRPSFSQMSPALTLNTNPLVAANNSGSQGNPNLKPIRATNYDLSLEDYFTKDSLVYVDGFYKDVTGFITSIGQTETYYGAQYVITRPVNLNPATIKGYEIGYHQFFTFLPAPFDGLGLQANYTYVLSSTPTTVSGQQFSLPLTNLSKKSYNLILMYQKGPFSARVAYNWRSDFTATYSYLVNVGLLPQVSRAYGDLDASLNYNLTKNLQLSLQGINLTNALRYYESGQFPANIYTDGMTLMANVTYRY